MDGSVTNRTTTEEAIWIAIPEIADSSFQKERASERGNIAELGASMKETGQQLPVLVRPISEQAKRTNPRARYELVDGHRRKRGAGAVGLKSLLCMVRNLTDVEVLESQSVANGQREDTHPLDDAENYAAQLERGRTPQQIADKIGRKVSYVVQRLELLKLAAVCRDALDRGTLTLGLALEIARIPDEKLQVAALEEVGGDDDSEPMSVSRGAEIIRGRFMLRLVDAPFDRGVADLVPAAGACTVCPKRTGNNLELFGDVDSPDVCTDTTCYRSKLDAHFKLELAQAKTTGKNVLPMKDAQKAFDRHGDRLNYNSEFYTLDHKVYAGGKNVGIAKLIKDSKVEVTLAQNPHTGTIHELVRKKSVDGIVAAKQKEARKSERAASSKASPAEKARRDRDALKAESKTRAGDLVLGAVVEKVTKLGAKADAAVFDLLFDSEAFYDFFDEGIEQVAKRRGLLSADSGGHIRDCEKTIRKWAGRASEAERRALLADLVLANMIHGYMNNRDELRVEAFCKAVGVDRKAIEKQAVAELAAEREKTSASTKESKPAAKASKNKAKRS